MNKRAATEKAEGSDREAGEGGYTHRLGIDYRAIYIEDGKRVIEQQPPDAKADGRLFAASEAMLHAEAISGLLTLVNERTLESMRPADAALIFGAIGELGRLIAGAAAHVEEARRELPI